MSDTPRLRIGGVLRCCSATWSELVENVHPIVNELPCNHCSRGTRRVKGEDNVWEANDE